MRWLQFKYYDIYITIITVGNAHGSERLISLSFFPRWLILSDNLAKLHCLHLGSNVILDVAMKFDFMYD